MTFCKSGTVSFELRKHVKKQWLKDILHHGIVRQNTTGMALSGGAIEGFLYQLGVLYALEKAFTGKKKVVEKWEAINLSSKSFLIYTLHNL